MRNIPRFTDVRQQASCSCGCSCGDSKTAAPGQDAFKAESKQWNIRYIAGITVAAALFGAVYAVLRPVSEWLVYDLAGLAPVGGPVSSAASAIAFFIYDTAKIGMLLIALMYAVSWLRTGLNIDRVKEYLTGKRRAVGYVSAALFGAVTPFCSCSGVPLFVGFASAGIPIGMTMAFLITSPLINELAVVLLWDLLGLKCTVLYVAVGMAAGIMGGVLTDALDAGRWAAPLGKRCGVTRRSLGVGLSLSAPTLRQRHEYALGETRTLFKKVWKWIVVGVGVGALLHGYVPDAWFAAHFGDGQWWTVPSAVFVGIPLYSNVTGIVPIMEGLLIKGMPLGTTLAFCMSSVAASLPEMIMLRQIMTAKLQGVFLLYLWVVFVLVGWMFNALQGVVLP